MTRDPRTLRPWQTLDRGSVYRCRLFVIDEWRRRSPRTGQVHDFFVLDSADWVNIIPLTPDGQVVMVRQYRHGVDDFTLEVPGGLIDPGDPSPLVAARREMQEESGYDSEDVVPLGTIHPNPAIQNNRCHTFLARSVTACREVCFDSTEETEVVLVPLGQIPDLIRTGVITHALVVVAFHHLMLAESTGLPGQSLRD